MECSGAAGRDDSIDMPSQSLTASVPSQPQSVVMTSQESQVDELMPSKDGDGQQREPGRHTDAKPVAVS